MLIANGLSVVMVVVVVVDRANAHGGGVVRAVATFVVVDVAHFQILFNFRLFYEVRLKSNQ